MPTVHIPIKHFTLVIFFGEAPHQEGGDSGEVKRTTSWGTSMHAAMPTYAGWQLRSSVKFVFTPGESFLPLFHSYEIVMIVMSDAQVDR